MGWGLALSVPKMGAIVPNMGMIKDEPIGLGDVLFSKTQRQVLGLLFGAPDKSYYANEIVRHAGVGSGTVQRELEKLTGAGLLTVSQVGNQKHYQANRQSPIFEELRGIVIKTFGLSDTLRSGLSGFAQRIKAAFIYGSVAKATDTASSDIDLMIVSPDLSYAEVMARLAEAESRVGRTINPTLYKPGEFARKRAEDNAFVNRVLEQPRIFLIGTEYDLR